MKLDPSRYYRMPLAMGPVADRKLLRLEFPQVEVLSFQYLTEPEPLADLLPDCYHPGREPLVTVSFSQNNGLSFMAGSGYRQASVTVSARFDGERDHLEGDYVVVVFANDPWPVTAFREDLGLPGLFAEVSSLKLLPDGHLRCEASQAGHMLFGLDVPPLKGQLGLVRGPVARQVNSRPWLGYKYIPSLEGPPDVEYPTSINQVSKFDRLWQGKKASLRFGFARQEDIGVVKNFIDTLATLTIIKPLQVLHYTGSSVLRYDLSHRLR